MTQHAYSQHDFLGLLVVVVHSEDALKRTRRILCVGNAVGRATNGGFLQQLPDILGVLEFRPIVVPGHGYEQVRFAKSREDS